MLAAVVARLANPDIHLAAYGSVTFPLIGILQAPILTLLSLSTTMSRDWESFLKGRRIMFVLGGGLTLLYSVIAFTPLYDVIVRDLIGAPPEVIEPARLGMFVGLPWCFAVAYRRFHQGVLIRFEHSRSVTVGTLLRFVMDVVVLAAGFLIGSIPGTVLATLMMVFGVITDAVYVGLRVRPVLRYELRRAPPVEPPIGLKQMILFFIPLGITPLLNMLIRPIGSAALSRLPDPLMTLAVWPVISSFSFLIVTPGAALHEVVIALLDRPGAKAALRRFMGIVMAVQLVLMILLGFTSLAYEWFTKVSGLTIRMAELGAHAFQIFDPHGIDQPAKQLVRRIDPPQSQVAAGDRGHGHLPGRIRGGAAGGRSAAQCERVVHCGDGFGAGQHDTNGLVVVPQPGGEERRLTNKHQTGAPRPFALIREYLIS